MLGAIARMSLGSKINKDNLNRKRHFLPWDQIQKIALVLHKNDQVNKSAMDKLVDGTKKFVEVFYVELDSKTPSYSDWRCFYKKDASLLGLPQQAVLSELQNKNFDLVINTSNDSELFATSLVSSLKAPFKCGCSKKFNDVDLIIKKTEPYNVMNYLDEVFRYVKMIRV
jgi:hypothetical protein